MPKLRSQEDIDAGLTALALEDGSSRRAAARLEQTGQAKIDERVLRYWRERHAERYTEIREKHLPAIRQRRIHRIEEVVDAGIEGAREAITQAREGMADLDADKSARAAKDIATASGIFNQNSLLLRGEPTVRVASDSDATELWARLEALISTVPHTVDSTAVEDATEAEDDATDTFPSPTRALAPVADRRDQSCVRGPGQDPSSDT